MHSSNPLILLIISLDNFVLINLNVTCDISNSKLEMFSIIERLIFNISLLIISNILSSGCSYPV